MLGSAPLNANIPVVDIERAKQFYQEKIGLRLIEQTPAGIILEAGKGTKLFIYQRAATKADHTVDSFSVKDVEVEVKELKAKGVVFEEYDTDEIKTIDGIAAHGQHKAAWFKDTEVNILGLTMLQSG